VAKQGYTIVTAAATGLTANTARSVLGVQANAAFGVDLRKFEIAFDGSSAATPVLVELCSATFGANPPGTNSTSVTPQQVYGRTTASGVTAASGWTTEPTVLTVLKSYLLTPNGGLLIEEFAPDHGYDSPVSQGFVIRCTSTTGVTPNVRATMEFERA